MKKKRVFGTGSELLVRHEVAHGVKYAFTNTGSAEAGFFNALVSENFRNTDHLLPFGFAKSQWRLIRTYGGSLGYGIDAAVGAQLGAPDRPVVCSLGNGAVMYSASGSWPMARYGLPVLTLVWNNLNSQTCGGFAGFAPLRRVRLAARAECPRGPMRIVFQRFRSRSTFRRGTKILLTVRPVVC